MTDVKLRRGLILFMPECLILEIITWWKEQPDHDSFMSASSVITCWQASRLAAK